MRLTYSYSFVPDFLAYTVALGQSTSKAAAQNVEDILVSIHACMHAFVFRYLHLIPPPGRKSDSFHMLWNVWNMASPWNDVQVPSAIWCMGLSVENTHGENSSACGMAAWQSWTINSVETQNSALHSIGFDMRDIDILYLMSPDMIKNYPRVLRETGAKTRETGAKRRETGAKKKVYHLALLLLSVVTVVACHAFLKTISWTEGTAIGSCARGGTSFPFVPWEFFHRTFQFMYCILYSSHSRFTWTPGAQVAFLFTCSWCVRGCACALCCDCDACVLHSEGTAWGFLSFEKSIDVVLCENCVIAEGCLL